MQIVPHLTDAIQRWIERVSQVPVDDSGNPPDVCIIEVSGFCFIILDMVLTPYSLARWNCRRSD